ncbi:hypothetical protein RCL1_001907 [Eukaryota sp. TZLM3-RCL]
MDDFLDDFEAMDDIPEYEELPSTVLVSPTVPQTPGLGTEELVCYSKDEILRVIQQALNSTMEITGLPAPISFQLLMSFNYDRAKLMEAYSEQGVSIISDRLHIDPSLCSHKPVFKNSACFCCYADLDFSSPTSLHYLCCGHVGCADCYPGYLESQISSSNSIDIHCILMGQCPLVCDPDFIRSRLSAPSIDRYNQFLLDHFIYASTRFVHCVGKQCGNIIYLPDPTPLVITCKCGVSFCPKCLHEEDHRPASCSDVRTWDDKGALDKHTSTWIKANTKPCPACAKKINKDGGCLHMTCSQCRHEFCWSCSGDWKSHRDAYNCSRFQESQQEQESRDEALRLLKRFNHCHDRFVNHFQGFEHEQKLHAKLDTKIAELYSQQESILDVSFIYEALEVLLTCRHHLKWSYVMIYSEPSDDSRFLFEFRQGKLEATVDKISEMLSKQQISNLLEQRGALDRLRMLALEQLSNILRG